jgi:hypothetical protein
LVPHDRGILAHIPSVIGHYASNWSRSDTGRYRLFLGHAPPAPVGWNHLRLKCRGGIPLRRGGGIRGIWGIGGRICNPCRHTNTQIKYPVVRFCRTLSSSIANQFSKILPNDSRRIDLSPRKLVGSWV